MTFNKNLDLLAIVAVAVLAWLLGNNVGTLGVFSAGSDNLGPGAALFFLSHNDAVHAKNNLDAAIAYSMILLLLRTYADLRDDQPYILGALATSHVLTLVTYVWLMPFSDLGSHGLSVATSALLGSLLMFGISTVAKRRGRDDVATLVISAACIAAAAFFAISAHRHGFETELLTGVMRGEAGHAIGFGCGLAFGVAHGLRKERSDVQTAV